MAHHHALLDDDELHMTLDDDMCALEALDDTDVDMDGLGQQHQNEQDGDVFRPSAMLDRRMEEEFGGAFYSTCFQASELVEKDLAGGFVDIEQMLLSESEEFLTAHFANTSDELLHAQLRNGEREQMNQQQRMIRAELTARHFLHAQSSGDNITDQQQRLVLLKQAIASSALSSSSIFNMPPKYFAGGGSSSPQKRRAHRRTFGERTQPFAFGTSNATAYKQEDQAATGGNSYHQQHTSGMHDATASDENYQPPISSATPSNEVYIKEEIVIDTGVAQLHTVALEITASKAMDDGHDDEQKAATVLDSRSQTPVTLLPFAGFRSISDDHHHEINGVHEEEALRATFRTPLRRSLSSPSPSQAAEQHFTPQQQQQLSGYSSRSMSPADAFDKVAVVVQVVKDSPGRVDKFEWRIGSPQQQQQQNDAKQVKKRPTLSTQLGKADASHVDDQASFKAAAETHDATNESSSALPPRYFRGVTSSPQKRRVHSTTFGSFARSFSFTGSAPPSDLRRLLAHFSMQDGDESDSLASRPAILGSAEVFLRPLRFMFDVETDIAVVTRHSISTAPSPRAETESDTLGHVHVHLAIATRPPLIERQQLNGFLRAERASGRDIGEFDHDPGGFDTEMQCTPQDARDDEELQSMRGAFVWLLVRMQDARPRRPLRNARVQYQLTPATESYLLPIEHTNVIKLLVTDELLDQIDTKTLEFTFISSPAATAPPPTAITVSTAPVSEAKAYEADTKSYAAELDAKELERARRAAEELEVKASMAVAAAQQAAQALEHERAQSKLRDLELQHEKSALDTRYEHERELLRAELQRREEQSSQLTQLTTQLESQLQGKEAFMGDLQQATRKTDQAIELLKQRMAGDAKEREELQRRLRALEDEKLALLNKSRACALQ